MHAVISLLLRSRKFWWYLLLSSSVLLHSVTFTSFNVQLFTVPVNLVYAKIMEFHDEHNILIKNLHGSIGYGTKKLTKEFPEKSWSKSGRSCSVVSTRDKSVLWTNWNCGSLMSALYSLEQPIFDEAMISGEEDFERVSVLKEHTMMIQLVNWQCWLCPHLLHPVWLVWLLHLQFTKSCQQPWSIHCCSFYKVVH